MTPAQVVPKYHRIYLVLREQILEGRFEDDLPGELALAEAYGVSRLTMRRAMERLEADGLVSRERGRRTRALSGAATDGGPGGIGTSDKSDIGSLLQDILAFGNKTNARVLEVSVIAGTAEVARLLQLPPGARVQKAIRVRSHRGAPMSYITTYLPDELARRISRRELGRKPMLGLLQGMGIRIGAIDQTLGAELADARVAEHLQVQVGSALLSVRRVVHDVAGRPIQLLFGLYRPDRYEYRMRLSPEGEATTRVWTAG